MESPVDFTDTDSFSKAAKTAPIFSVSDPTNPRTKITFTNINLKRSKMYRAGTKIMEDRRADGLGFPLFFSDIGSISPYANSGRPVRKYITTKQLRLMEFTMENIIKLIDLSVKKGKVGIESFLVKSDPNKVAYDAIFPTQPDLHYEKNNPGVSQEFKYMNRTIAQCVCEIGFDGWVAMPGNDVKQQVIDREMIEMFRKIKTAIKTEQDKEKTQQSKEKIEKLESMIEKLMSVQKYDYVDYAPEILVCNPSENIIMMEEPKVEEPKVEEPKVEEPKVEESKTRVSPQTKRGGKHRDRKHRDRKHRGGKHRGVSRKDRSRKDRNHSRRKTRNSRK
jgi:hypothetical protein